MVYITNANYKKIIRRINISEIENILDDEPYKKPIYFLSSWEKQNLLLYKMLLKEPEKFYIEYYQPAKVKDSYKYVFETNANPAYHSDKTCEKLNSDYKNFEIPFEIKARVETYAKKKNIPGKEKDILISTKVNQFRLWFKSHLIIYKQDPELFLKRLEVQWNIKRNVEEIEKDNSGIHKIKNLNLNKLELEIDNILREAARFFNESDKKELIRRFQKLTFLAYKKDKIYHNDTGFTDNELKAFLKEYDIKFKKPVKELLIEYYRVKYNPFLSFDNHLLQELNFKPCHTCYCGVKSYGHNCYAFPLLSAS